MGLPCKDPGILGGIFRDPFLGKIAHTVIGLRALPFTRVASLPFPLDPFAWPSLHASTFPYAP